MCGYIGQCLSRVPRSSYRERLAAELADHLESLAEALEQGGRTPLQARAEAVEQLGDPEELALQYQSAWQRHAGAPQYWVPRLCLGCVCTGAAYFAVFAAMAALGITYDREPGIPMQGDSALTALVGALLFLVPFSAGTMCLMRTLEGCPGQRKLVTSRAAAGLGGRKGRHSRFERFDLRNASVGPRPTDRPDQRRRRSHGAMVHARLYPADLGGVCGDGSGVRGPAPIRKKPLRAIEAGRAPN